MRKERGVRWVAADGFGYLVWQAGGPKWDYWPLAVVLLAGVGAIDLALMLRGRLRRRAA